MVTHPDNFLGVGYRAHNGQNKSKKREKEREEREANEGNFPALTGNVTAGTPERNKKMLKTKEGQKEQTLVHTIVELPMQVPPEILSLSNLASRWCAHDGGNRR